MKISICIPQYNRIAYLKIALNDIAKQNFKNLEICISDDASTDSTPTEINKLIPNYPFPIVYHRFDVNQGYDKNLRTAMEIATGDYLFILGNDDTLSDVSALSRLANFLTTNNLPEVGFCNSTDYVNNDNVQIRAKETKVIGTGAAVALKYYSSFSFVAGLIFKRNSFLAHNTNEFDGSIYVQIYLACSIICNNGRFFTYDEALVHKDIRVDHKIANSYREKLPRKWKQYEKLDSGLPSYTNVAYEAIRRSLKDENKSKETAYAILKRVYSFTYPFWLADFRENDAFVASIGLVAGLPPTRFAFYDQLGLLSKTKINLLYLASSVVGVLTPLTVYKKVKNKLYQIAKA